MTLIPTKRAEIEKRAEAATPGPWSPRGVALTLEQAQVTNRLSPEQAEIDGEFIAHARQDIPDLLRALSSTEQKLAKAVEALERIFAPHKDKGDHLYGHIYSANCDACHREEIARSTLASIREETR